MHLSAIAALGFAATTSAISVLLPLYTYPAASPAAWQPVYDALDNYPKIKFYIVVNPNSGPGCSGCSYPTDANYVAAITKLNTAKNKNAFTLGYVSTNFGKRAYSAVQADVATYAKWGYYTPSNVSMAGIFFDEMNTSTTATNVQFYKNASTYAYNNVPSDITPVVFNPGVPSPATFFNYADFIVECENYYSSYSYPGTINTFTSGYNSQAAILLHDTPSAADLSALVHPMITKSIGAVYVCPDGIYNNLSLLKNLTIAINKG